MDPPKATPVLYSPLKAVHPTASLTPVAAASPAPPPAADPKPTIRPLPTGFYRAIGTEPFWAASIVADRLSFALPGEAAQNFDVTLTEKGGVRRYAGAGIAITVKPEPCSDGMSDASYPDRVQIAMGDRTLKGCGGEPAQGRRGK